MQHAIAKLANGEQVIGELVNITSTTIVLKNPRTVLISPDYQQVMFAPFLLTEDTELSLNRDICIACSDSVPQGMIDAYRANVTGIQVAKGNGPRLIRN